VTCASGLKIDLRAMRPRRRRTIRIGARPALAATKSSPTSRLKHARKETAGTRDRFTSGVEPCGPAVTFRRPDKSSIGRLPVDDWPDEAYRTWRYQRASLARLLANEGMMRDVADAYEQSGSRR
jgi:hypothetical protein